MGKEKITFEQGLEVASWLARLSRDEYQKRRSVLRKVTDPRWKPSGEIAHPFLTPLNKGLRLEKEGPSCDEPINIRDLDFIAGDVVGHDYKESGSSMYICFSQHHVEHLVTRADELPHFRDGTEIVFPGTVYITMDVNRIEFFACITYYAVGLHLDLIARSEAFKPTCRYPYQLHTRR